MTSPNGSVIAEPEMESGETITQNFMLQLGAENSGILPDIRSGTVADVIAEEYIQG